MTPTGAFRSTGVDADRAREVLRRLELDITIRLDGLLQGDYRGLIPGHGSELGEAREYAPGDDVRRIDWNVTARLHVPHIRQTIADRELETRILVDLSPSLEFGTAKYEKRDLALAATAAMGFLTARVGNRVGAVVLHGSKPIIVPARQGRAHLLGLLHRIVELPRHDSEVAYTQTVPDLAQGLDRLASGHQRRGLAVVVSDFLSSSGWSERLQRVATRHETLAIEIVDPRELELPDVGMLAVIDPETGARREIPTHKSAVRERYATAAAAQRAAIAADIRGAGADHLILRTDGDWLMDLARFVAVRRKRNELIPRRHLR